jgi:hypothetical protein
MMIFDRTKEDILPLFPYPLSPTSFNLFAEFLTLYVVGWGWIAVKLWGSMPHNFTLSHLIDFGYIASL